MVNEADERRLKAEKLLVEAELKVDMLTAEVQALKTVVQGPSSRAGLLANHRPLFGGAISTSSHSRLSQACFSEETRARCGRRHAQIPESAHSP